MILSVQQGWRLEMVTPEESWSLVGEFLRRTCPVPVGNRELG